jgi:ABC-2 type transport system permease protein
VRWINTALDLFVYQSQIKLQQYMQYRIDFFFGLLLTFGSAAIGPLSQFLIYNHSQGYPGWDINQILLFQGVFLLSSGIQTAIFGDVQGKVSRLISKGVFDQVLLKPFPPLLQILSGGFSPYNVGTLLVGGFLVAWTWARSGAAITVSAFLLFLVLLAAGVLLALTASVFYSACTLRWVYPYRLGYILRDMFYYTNYPLEVYPTMMRNIFVTLLPFSIVVHWPAQALLGRLDAWAWVAAGATLALWLLVVWFWERQLKQYVSAGG